MTGKVVSMQGSNPDQIPNLTDEEMLLCSADITVAEDASFIFLAAPTSDSEQSLSEDAVAFLQDFMSRDESHFDFSVLDSKELTTKDG